MKLKEALANVSKLATSQVVIYHGAMETTVVREGAKYRFSEMIAAVGSNLNCFTGLTFLVIFEFIDVLIAWVSFEPREEQ